MKVSQLTTMILVGALSVAACGGANGGSQNPATDAPGAAASAPVVATPTPTDAPAAATPATLATKIIVEAIDSAFDTKTITAPANTEIKVILNNVGELPHDIAFFDKEGGNLLAKNTASEIIQGGQTTTITFTTPGAGSYFFVCLVHPQEMTGTFVVE